MTPRSKEELDALAIIDPEVDAKPSSRIPPAVPEVTESTQKYKTRDGAELNLITFQATEPAPGSQPLIIFFHGGGGVVGSASSVAPLARELVKDQGSVVISPQYRLAPEHPFPTGPDDGWDAFEYIVTHISSLGAQIDPSLGLVVGGSSQGAVLASLIALHAKEKTPPLPKITGLYFAAGGFIASPDTIPEKYKHQYLSRTDERCVNAPVLDKETKAMFDMAYNPDMSSPLYRAFNVQPLSRHADVAAKAYFQVCGLDILRDDTLIYASVLQDLGVDVKFDVYEGAPHVFWSVFIWTKLAGRWKDETKRGVKWLLGREDSRL
ncbi:uncharacterized protein A1O5_09793 [Cladophialophora psammophila CBS 110553]|uniref:Alpha/beta hydrolase fold-3 domain-containing protein n=1 Tax=Cladophialophora psammophila CBS 110553 TaxID=1182543 RepID=W9WR41_9EURO|nr:uncharacterized protein A1O5_09793 [Cladophialophora psammophila CBS 110553]EXJ67146.1 hypothetical protein A1O5_09793 [Cladophialophora psammophila CBS 110553]